MSTTLSSVARVLYRLGFEISPIILTNGIASAIPGQMLPIVVITEALDLVNGLITSGSVPDLDAFFAHFRALPGASLISQIIGKYPFANQAVAGNATIQQPLNISLLMACPVNQIGGHTSKFITFLALKAVLDQHNKLGGLYTVAAPAGIWTNGVLLNLTDISASDSEIPQNTWRWDFEFPLITLAQAAAAQNTLMSKLSAGLPTDGSLSGGSIAATSPLTGAAPSLSPSAANLIGSGQGGFVSAAVQPVTSSPLTSP